MCVGWFVLIYICLLFALFNIWFYYIIIRNVLNRVESVSFQAEHRGSKVVVGVGRCPQREQETPSDSPPALIGCLIRSCWILANGLRGSRWSQRSMIFFTDSVSCLT